MRRWDGLVEKYAKVCEIRGLAGVTIVKRTRELERFGLWLKRRRPKVQLEEIDADLVIRYIQHRTAFRSRATVSSVASELRCMGEFLVGERVWRSNPLRWIRGPKLDRRERLPRRVGREQMKKLWAAAESRSREHSRHQAVCALALLYGTGLRRGELERLDIGDWDRDGGLLKVDGRKTGRARQVPVGAGVWRCVEAYLPHRHNLLEKTGRLQEQALLLNRDGKRLRGTSIGSLVRRLADSAGVEAVTAHQFRHSCASDLLEEGASLVEVRRILGHAALESTMRYIDIADPERVTAMSKHPINEFLIEARRQAS